MTTRICDTNGINIHFTRTGGSKPPMVLLHGLTANGACWTSVARELENNYDVIMPDARGHGSSSKPASGYLYEDLANDVVGLIKALHLLPVILIGHSMGGLTAALLASQQPELLCGLILAEPSFLSLKVQHEVHDSDVMEQHQRYLKMTLDEVMCEIQSRHPHRSIEAIKQIAQGKLQTSLAVFEVLTPPNPNYVQVVSTIKVPSLLVIGGSTGGVSTELAAELQRINPMLQVEQIPEAGHGMHYDYPERFVEIVKVFLGSL